MIVAAAGVVASPAMAQLRSVTCAECHAVQAEQLRGSVHREAVRCQDCHGGAGAYDVPAELRQAFLGAGASRPAAFDHGTEFRGRATRTGVLEVCGNCHADVERMNPYGLRTDQLRAYWLSGHGKRLKFYADERVAVCIDCHGAHDVLPQADARSRTHFTNIPATCARCHADAALMQTYGLSPEIPEQYRRSVHGRNTLEKNDAGSPTCTTCHGSHAAAPPGFAQVGHVCGQCHKQIEEYVLSSVHGRIAVVARCTGCHGAGGNPRDHQIMEVTPPAEALVQTYLRARREVGDAPERLAARFRELLDARPDALRPDAVCGYCHGPGRQDPHARFLAESDQTILERGAELSVALRGAELEYARTAERVARLAEGVLLVRDEAVRAEDAKTEVMALHAFMHTFNQAEIQARLDKLSGVCQEINAALDQKESGLAWRHRALLPVWAFAVVFFALMYRKYVLLRRAYVQAADARGAPGGAGGAELGRRRALDALLRVMGAAAVVALAWPAIAYVLPGRRRGGSGERASAGPEAGWKVWEARKLALAGKPVAVIRTEQGFKALSLVCTHLGCVVHWDEASREFSCPCHAARFGAAGQVISGPPPRPLPEYAVAVVQGEVLVTGGQGG